MSPNAQYQKPQTLKHTSPECAWRLSYFAFDVFSFFVSGNALFVGN
jgi:hypothetical protein